MERVRVHSQCVPNLRELCESIDKDYSRRAASQLAIPLLLNEINLMGDPEEAQGRLRWMVDDQSLTRALMGVGDNSDGTLFLRCFEQILRGGQKKKSGSRS